MTRKEALKIAHDVTNVVDDAILVDGVAAALLRAHEEGFRECREAAAKELRELKEVAISYRDRHLSESSTSSSDVVFHDGEVKALDLAATLILTLPMPSREELTPSSTGAG